MENEYGLLIEWGARISVGLLIAAFVSWITVRFALKRFVSEKLWEKRAEAYGAILGALHDMKRYPDQVLGSFGIKGRDIPEDQRKALLVKYREGQHELNRRGEVGQFFLSDNLLTAISTLNKSLASATNTDDGYSVVDDSWAAINVAQEDIRTIAKSHLAVR